MLSSTLSDPQDHLEMLLPELEVHLLACRGLAGLPDRPRRRIGTTEVHTDVCSQRALQTAHVAAIQDAIAHATQQAREIGTTKVGTGLKLSEGILVGAYRVQHDVVRRVDIDLLGEVGVDAQELIAIAAAHGLRFQRGKQILEPFKRRGILADPDKLYTAEALGRIGRQAHMVDGFEDGCPGCDTDTGTNEDGDFVLEDIFGGSSVRAIDADGGHLLPVLQRDLVHAHGIQFVVEFGLRLTSAEVIGKLTGEITNLSDVHGNVGIFQAGCDGKRMPLVVADIGAVEEKPLPRLVLHARF